MLLSAHRRRRHHLSPLLPPLLFCLLPRSVDGAEWLFVGGAEESDGDARLSSWDADSLVRTSDMAAHRQAIVGVTPLADGRVATASADGFIKVWAPPSTGAVAQVDTKAAVRCLQALPDGRIASASADGRIRLWDAARGALSDAFAGHETAVTDLSLLPDGRLVSCSEGGSVKLWNTAAATEAASFRHPADLAVRRCTALPDGRVAGISADGLRVWGLGAAAVLLKGCGGALRSVAALPDGRVATGAADGTVCVWNVAAASSVSGLGHGGKDVSSLAVTANGTLVSGGGDASVAFWSTNDTAAAQVRTLAVGAPVQSLAAASVVATAVPATPAPTGAPVVANETESPPCAVCPVCSDSKAGQVAGLAAGLGLSFFLNLVLLALAFVPRGRGHVAQRDEALMGGEKSNPLHMFRTTSPGDEPYARPSPYCVHPAIE